MRTTRPNASSFLPGALLAVGLVVLATGIRWPLWPLVGQTFPFLFFYPAVFASALYGGFWPGVLATALSVLSANFLLFEPRFALGLSGWGDSLAISAFALVGLASSLFAHKLRGARAAAVDAAATAERERKALRVHVGLLDLAPVMVRSEDGRIMFWNTGLEELYGFSRDEAVGRFSHDLLQTKFPRALAEILDELKQHGRWQGELVHTCKNGSPLVVISRWVVDRQAGPVVLEVNADVTAQRAAERERQVLLDELQRASAEKDRFLAILAHELRNPLAPIVNAMHILRLSPAGAPARERAVATVERQAFHLKRLIDDLLTVSRINRGVFEIDRKRIDLVEVVRAELIDCRMDPKTAVVPLLDQLPQAPLWIDGDPVRLSQIVQNLLQNAYKFTGPDGRVEVVLHQQGSEAVMTIRDTGIGIPPQDLARIFEPFVQTDRRPERPSGGLGLGLAIVKRLAALHGGSVEARSKGLAKGSEFTVRLPIAAN